MELERQVVAFNNAADNQPVAEPSVISGHYEGIYQRITRIRSHLTAATATWSGIHDQCLQIKGALEPAMDDRAEDVEVVKLYLESSRTIASFLSVAMMEYAMAIRSIGWKLWWLSNSRVTRW